MTQKNENYACPCCRFLTLSEPYCGTFEICPVCFWEDDIVQYNDPEFKGGANQESLNEARKNFEKFGASSTEFAKFVRPPLPEEIP